MPPGFVTNAVSLSGGKVGDVRFFIDQLKKPAADRTFDIDDPTTLPNAMSESERFTYLFEKLANSRDTDIEVVKVVAAILAFSKESLSTVQVVSILLQGHTDEFTLNDMNIRNSLRHASLFLQENERWELESALLTQFIKKNARFKLARMFSAKCLLKWCAAWNDHKDPYVFWHFSDHLQEADKASELIALVLDERFKRSHFLNFGRYWPTDRLYKQAMEATLQIGDLAKTAELIFARVAYRKTVVGLSPYKNFNLLLKKPELFTDVVSLLEGEAEKLLWLLLYAQAWNARADKNRARSIIDEHIPHLFFR